MTRVLVVGASATLLVAAISGIASQQRRDGEMQPIAPEHRQGVWSTEQSQSPSERLVATLPGARVIQWKNPVTIADRLLAADEHVEIVRLISEPEPDMATSADAELGALAKRAAAAAVVRVDDIASQLTPSKDWVQSTLSVTVVEVLKSQTKSALAVGQSIKIPFNGGDIVVDGRHVRARYSPHNVPAVGAEYLYFFFDLDGVLRPFDPAHTFKLGEGSIERGQRGVRGELDSGIGAAVLLNKVRMSIARAK